MRLRNYDTSLFSLLLLSYIVVLIRELADRLYPTIFKPQNNFQEMSKWYSMEIETDFIREHSVFLSPNSSRKTSVILAGLSINYTEYI